MRILFLISALLLASCSADQQNNNTSTDVSVSFGQSIASGAISSGIPDSVQSVTLVALAVDGTVLAGPLVANRPNFTLKIRVPNGNNIQLRLRAYSQINAGGKILHEGLSKPLDLKGKPVTVSMTMNLSVSILASSTPIFRGAPINLAGFVSGSTPPATSPLIWSATDASGATATPPNVTDSYGGLVTWIAPDNPGTYTIYAEVDRSVNNSQQAGFQASANITVINQDPYIASSSNLPLIANSGVTVDYYAYLTIADHDINDMLSVNTVSKPAWVTITPSASKNPLSLDIRLSPSGDVAPGVYAFSLRVSDGFGGSVSGEVEVTVAPSGPTNISSANGNNTPCNTVWTAGASPYIIESPVTIATGCTLQIDGGALVLFNAGKIISVNGTLNVLGTSALPVSFDSYTAPFGDWERIEYLEGSSGTMQFAQISFAGVGTKPTTDSALFIASSIDLYSVFMVGSKSKGIFFASGTSTASDLAIIGTTSNPIYIDDSFITTAGNAVDVSITGNNYISNTASVSSIFVTGANTTVAISGFETEGGNRGLTVDNGAAATVKNNVFHSAQSDGIALSIGANPTGKVVLQDNIISGNANVGISVVKAGVGSLIQSNIIRGNTKGGINIATTQAQPISLYNNLIVENQGSGIAVLSGTSVDIYSNTVADNYSALATGAGLELGASASVAMENNIFASNATTITLPPTPQDIYTAGAALTANNNIATDASLTGFNFSTAPTFIAGWYLTDGSNFAGIATTPSPSGINNGSALFSNFPFLSSPTPPTPPYLYAQAATSDAGTTVDLGYHQAQVAVPVTQASIQNVVGIDANTSRVIFALSDASNNVVLQPEKLTITIALATPTGVTIISPIYQIGQGLYAVDIDRTGIASGTIDFQISLPYLINSLPLNNVTYN